MDRIAGRSIAARTVAIALSVVATVIWVVPYLWMLVTSFKTLPEIVSKPTAILPDAVQLGAYREVFQTISVGRYFAITTVMALLIAALQIALALPAGYALAKLRFRGRSTVFGLVIACLLVPAQVTFVPVFLFFAKLGLVNTMAALVLPFAVSALGTFLVRQALSAIPDSIIEAARLDGASEATIVYRILAPNLMPTLVSLFLLSVVFHWNDYFWPLVMTTDETVRTLPLGVALFREQGSGVRWHVVMAANVVLSVPALALFAVAQRHLVRAVAGKLRPAPTDLATAHFCRSLRAPWHALCPITSCRFFDRSFRPIFLCSTPPICTSSGRTGPRYLRLIHALSCFRAPPTRWRACSSSARARTSPSCHPEVALASQEARSPHVESS